MKSKKILNLFLALSLCWVFACASSQSTNDDNSSSATSSSDEFADFESGGGQASDSPEAGIESEIANNDTSANNNNQATAQDEFSEFENGSAATTQSEEQLAPEPTENLAQEPTPAEPAVPEPSLTEPMPESEPIAEEPAPPAEEPAPEAPVQEHIASANGRTANITGIQYRAGDNGGTVVIDADSPVDFNQRFNPSTNQFVIEIPNSKLPRKLRRPFNTRDIEGSIGGIDAYQAKNSKTTRIVVQLRTGAAEPVIQAEGKSLFVIAQPPANQVVQDSEEAQAPLPSQLLATAGIEEFLSTNQKFYGKKISIETDDAELRDIFRLISEESGVNLVISDEVKGKISLKLKAVPWDQALVMIMKTKKLGYTRAGNVLRIAPLNDIKSEEEDAQKLIAAKKANAPMNIKNIQVNYAKVDELEKQIKPLLTTKGTVVGDIRTSTLIVSDIDENIIRAEKLVRTLDIPPQQVLIEGKVVEASDEFERSIGVNWGASGKPTGSGNLRSSTDFSLGGSPITTTTVGLNFRLGTLDILGNLNASLNLFERQGLVKIVSSPRVLALHNEPAEIGQVDELPIITTTPNPGGAPTPTVTYKQVRLKLQVTPQVSNDGVVLLGVDVMREIPGPVSDETSKARAISSRSAKTKVMVRNSQTAVIGGIFQNDMADSETRVPGLGSLPVVGWLFKSKSVNKKRSELMIFITPRIMGQLESASAVSSGSGDFQ